MIEKPLIIGITGNIATGKSVIRRMLGNAGALGIDADVLAHRMLYPGGPAYQAVINTFGTQILTDNQQISNQKLGEIVFKDPEHLQQLEALIHPPVINAIYKRIRAAKSPIIVIEAIKLLEVGLADLCDCVYVSHAAHNYQLQRLMSSRGMTEKQAEERINLQPPQSLKLSQADCIINTEGSFMDTWKRTQKALNDTIQALKNDKLQHINNSYDGMIKTVTSVSVLQLESSWRELSKQNIPILYEQLGMRKLFPVIKKKHIKAFVIWEDWNFTGILEAVYPIKILRQMPEVVFDAYEKHAHLAQTEILMISQSHIKGLESTLVQLGLTQGQTDELNYPAWKKSALKAKANHKSHIWVKILSQPLEILDEPVYR